jgi:hypothetical protein
MINQKIKCNINGEDLHCFIIKITETHIYLIESGIYNINQIPTMIHLSKLKIIN